MTGRPASADCERLLTVLVENGVRFILIGGWAAILHGSARSTMDVDVVYCREAENIGRLVAALGPYAPYPRDVPEGLPFHWDDRTIKLGLNFTLNTTLGPMDLLGDVPGGGSYVELLPFAEETSAFGVSFQVVKLEKLIALKRATGRAKDLLPLAELTALLADRGSV